VAELDDGRSVFFTRDVKPGERVEVRLPCAANAVQEHR
jgi:hypothetical protein